MHTRPLGFGHVYRMLCLAAIAGAPLSLGCQRDAYVDAYFDMLNAEKRVLEDRLYETQYDYEQALAELETLRGGAKGGRKPESRKRASDSARPSTEPAQDEPPEDSGVPKEAPELPKIELPPGVEEGKRQPPAPGVMRQASTVKDASPGVATKPRALNDDELAAAIVSALDQRVESVHLNPRLTGGADFDGQPGDDGICVLVEPRNRSGDFVPEAARISIVMLDPARSGEAARIARWELDAEAARAFLRTDSLDQGLLLRLPWQEALPQGNRAHLFVRYFAADGRKLEADQEIETKSYERIAQSWTPRRDGPQEDSTHREATVSWQQDKTKETPAVAQAVAEQPVSDSIPKGTVAPVSTVSSPVDANKTPPTSGVKAAAPLTPKKPTGRFWKPDR